MSDNCHVDSIEKKALTEELENTVTIQLAIYGMGCPRCATRVRNSMIAIYGVCHVDVDHTVGRAMVTFAPKLTTTDTIVDAVAQAGNTTGHHKYWAVPLS